MEDETVNRKKDSVRVEESGLIRWERQWIKEK
jgi:hypothetical protein